VGCLVVLCVCSVRCVTQVGIPANRGGVRHEHAQLQGHRSEVEQLHWDPDLPIALYFTGTKGKIKVIWAKITEITEVIAFRTIRVQKRRLRDRTERKAI